MKYLYLLVVCCIALVIQAQPVESEVVKTVLQNRILELEQELRELEKQKKAQNSEYGNVTEQSLQRELECIQQDLKNYK